MDSGANTVRHYTGEQGMYMYTVDGAWVSGLVSVEIRSFCIDSRGNGRLLSSAQLAGFSDSALLGMLMAVGRRSASLGEMGLLLIQAGHALVLLSWP
jgi:hypothetical protein